MSPNTSKSTSLVLVLAAASPVGIGLFALLLAFGVPPVTAWFWPTPTTNIAEAAALGDAARVRSLVAEGVPLDAPVPLRDDIRNRETPPVMVPLEAAVRHRSEYVVELLLELGVRPPVDEARRLHCMAAAMEADTIAALIQEQFDLSSPSCEITAGAP